MGIRHQQPAQAVDGQAARAVDVELGRAPAAEILAVAVEDLDPVGQVREIEVVVGIERSGPRLVQPPGLDSVNAPDQVRRGAGGEVATRQGEQTETRTSTRSDSARILFPHRCHSTC